jgi:hypothetical protein
MLSNAGGSQTLSGRDPIHVPGRDAALFVPRHASRRLQGPRRAAGGTDEVFLVVGSQCDTGGRGIGDV